MAQHTSLRDKNRLQASKMSLTLKKSHSSQQSFVLEIDVYVIISSSLIGLIYPTKTTPAWFPGSVFWGKVQRACEQGWKQHQDKAATRQWRETKQDGGE